MVDNYIDIKPPINSRNSKKHKNNSTGYNGITQRTSGYYESYIRVNRKQIYLGQFKVINYAINARQAYIEAHPELGFTSRHGT